jgi:hypothetical protein
MKARRSSLKYLKRLAAIAPLVLPRLGASAGEALLFEHVLAKFPQTATSLASIAPHLEGAQALSAALRRLKPEPILRYTPRLTIPVCPINPRHVGGVAATRARRHEPHWNQPSFAIGTLRSRTLLHRSTPVHHSTTLLTEKPRWKPDELQAGRLRVLWIPSARRSPQLIHSQLGRESVARYRLPHAAWWPLVPSDGHERLPEDVDDRARPERRHAFRQSDRANAPLPCSHQRSPSARTRTTRSTDRIEFIVDQPGPLSVNCFNSRSSGVLD